MADDATARDIERAVGAALSRSGVGGRVVLRERMVELHAPGRDVVAIDLGDWVDQWNLLPEDIREARADRAALRLRNAARQAQGRSPLRDAPGGIRPALRKALLPGVAFGLVALVVLVLYRHQFFGATDGDPGSAASTPEREPEEAMSSGAPPAETRAQRDARACDAGRRRLYAGAALDLDVAGWVVELWVADSGRALGGEKALRDAAAVGPREVDIPEGSGAAALVEASPGWLGARATVIRFTDAYVGRFFASEGRDAFIAFSRRAVRETGARYAALYARCAHREVRDVGAWYYGRDQPSALATLWLAAGAYAEQPAVARARLEQGNALPRLVDAARAAPPPDLDAKMRGEGVRVIRDPDGSVAFRFPLGGPTRAAGLSRTLADGLDARLE
ncbi:MAG: hypothetical protein AAGN82_07350 [Myxococcota bacterium]